MSDLSPRARELIQASRDSEQPSEAALERNLEALRARIAASPAPSDLSPLASHAPFAWVAGGAMGAAVAVGALYWILSGGSVPAEHQHSSLPSSPVVSPSANVPSVELAVKPRAVPEQPEPPVVRTAAAPDLGKRASPSAAHPTRQPDRFAEEVSLMSQATSALAAGHAASALGLLEEHQRLFPTGVLRTERRAARAQALCSLGRTKEAARELALLDPNSIQAARAQQACARSLKY